ncbi:MAG: AAA family ATPase [Clostridiales bacterium]|nr:AAA family ATPase [Clostridiales bacterium]
MRPRYLEVKGLQSFKEVQRIDFDALGETGLFGIFGPTGSGKSTVLDAITLALYGSVQRAGKGSRGTQGIINTDMDEVKVSFTFDLFKEGARKTYRVDRVYRRRKGSDVSAENRLSRLYEMAKEGDIVIADKLGDVNSKVQDLIGLNSEDFTRSVVLPQNKFQEFLMLDGADRRKMLERIFYLEEYGQRLTEKLSTRLNFVEKQLKNVEGAISSLGDASAEALQAAERRLKEAAAFKDKADRELQLIEKELGAAREVWELQAELQAIAREEKTLLSRGPEMEEKRRLHRMAVKAGELEGAIGKYNELKGSLTDTIVQLEDINNKLLLLEEDRRRVTELYTLKKQEAEKEIPVLYEQKSRLKDALALENEIGDIDKRLKDLRSKYSELERLSKEKEQQINTAKEQLARTEETLIEIKSQSEALMVAPEYRREMGMGVRLEEELGRLEEELRRQAEKHEKAKADIADLERELEKTAESRQQAKERLETEKARLEELEGSRPYRREDLKKDIDELHRLQLGFQALEAAVEEVGTLEQKLGDLDLRAEEKQEELAEAKAQSEALRRDVDTKRRELESLRLMYERRAAFILAKGLKENEACPVCGSTHHPAPALQPEGEEVRDIERWLEECQERLEAAQRRYRDAEGVCLVLEEQLKGILAQRGQVSEELDAAREKHRALIAGLPAVMQSLDIKGLERQLAVLAAQNDSRLKAIEGWENACAKARDSVLALSQDYSDVTVKHNSKKAELEVNRQGLEGMTQALHKLSTALEEKRKEHAAFLRRFGIQSARSEMEAIEDKDRRAQGLQQEQEKLQHKAGELRDILEKLTAERHSVNSRLSVIEAEGRGLKERRDKESSRLAVLTGGKDVKTALQAVDYRLKELERQEKDLQDSVKALDKKHNEACQHKSSLENQQRIYKQSLDAEEQQLGQSLRERGFESIEQAVGFLLPEEDLQALADEIQGYDEQLKEVKAQKKVCQRKLKGRSLSEEDWSRINEEYSTRKHQKEEGISLYQEARVNFSRMKDNHARWKDLSNKYRELERKRDMLTQIQRLLRGNSFVEYISEERLRYIAREASQTLAMLTRYRYSLELDTGQGFVVRDNANGGVCRAVSTLSGGETFLTSLSLALALSKQIQLKGQSPLEFFFLDEGFGTLDSGLLDIVVDALERLSCKERIIGVISHVPELKNRIARRLIVEPPSVDGRGSRVFMERA